MKIESLKDLEAVFKLCRKQGVRQFKLGEINFTLEDMPEKEPKGGATEPEKPEQNVTEEDILFWSANPGA